MRRQSNLPYFNLYCLNKSKMRLPQVFREVFLLANIARENFSQRRSGLLLYKLADKPVNTRTVFARSQHKLTVIINNYRRQSNLPYFNLYCFNKSKMRLPQSFRGSLFAGKHCTGKLFAKT